MSTESEADRESPQLEPQNDVMPVNDSTEAERDDATAVDAESDADLLASMSARLERIEQTLQSLQQTMDERLRYDDAKESAFNRLYTDLDEQKKRSTAYSVSYRGSASCHGGSLGGAGWRLPALEATPRGR